MFRDTKAFSGFSVNNLQKAKDFYQNILGLDVSEINGVLQLNISGGNGIVVYPKPNHSPATFTILNFPVDNIETAVEQLNKRGVHFLQYEGAIKTNEKGISHAGGINIAWFQDPAGNILSILETKQS
jgi:predicted enzyme related to lactoylglutathione lyase